MSHKVELTTAELAFICSALRAEAARSDEDSRRCKELAAAGVQGADETAAFWCGNAAVYRQLERKLSARM